MSPAEAGRMYRQVMADITTYLREMGIDEKYANLMTETGSPQVRRVRPSDDPILFSWDPAFREWLLTKCGRVITEQWGNCSIQVEGEATVSEIKKLLSN